MSREWAKGRTRKGNLGTMMPPCCVLCEDENCSLIFFAECPEDQEWYRRAKEPGFTGHPPNAYWFCTQHFNTAEKYAHLQSKAALAKIKEEL